MIEGLTTELLGASIVLLVGLTWRHYLQPFFEWLIKRDYPNIAGMWIAKYDEDTEDQIELKQLASKVWGRIVVF